MNESDKLEGMQEGGGREDYYANPYVTGSSRDIYETPEVVESVSVVEAAAEPPVAVADTHGLFSGNQTGSQNGVYGAQPPYGNQAGAYGAQPPYGNQTDGYGMQPPYGNQAQGEGYGAQPPYGGQAQGEGYGAQSPYGMSRMAD